MMGYCNIENIEYRMVCALMKVLMVCTIASMIGNFNMSNISILKKSGYEVHVACNFLKGSSWSEKRSYELREKLVNELHVKCYQVDFERSPLKISKNIKAYKELSKIIDNNNYEFVHCQTPMGAAITRIVTMKKNVKVMYTAHGFHFFKGAPLKNWLLFYPVEKWLSRYTDVLVTINDEDFRIASRKFNSGRVVEIPGAGVEISRFRYNERYKNQIRKKLGITSEKTMLLSVGELNDNKNHQIILKALNILKNNNVVYVIAGIGPKKESLQSLAKKYGIENQVKLIGYKKDIEKYYSAADIFVFPSKREGLSFAGIEAMAAGLPIVGSNIRGVKDYVYESKSGYLLPHDDYKGFAKKLNELIVNPNLRKRMGKYNTQSACKYDVKNVNKIMEKVYGLM